MQCLMGKFEMASAQSGGGFCVGTGRRVGKGLWGLGHFNLEMG